MSTIVDGCFSFVNRMAAWVRSRSSTGLLASGVAAGAAMCLYKVIKGRRRRSSLLKALGGTSGFTPFLGFVPTSAEHLFYALDILADTYGDIYAIKLMGRESVVLTDLESIREVLKARPHSYIRSFNKDEILPISGILTSEGEEWKRNRRLTAPAFNEHNSAGMVQAMAVMAKRLVRQLRKLGRQGDGRIVWEPREWLTPCTLDSLCLTTFGMDFYFLNPDGVTIAVGTKEIAESIRHFLKGSTYVLDRVMFPYMTRNRFPWNLNPRIKKFYSSIERLKKFANDLAVQRRREGGELGRAELLDKLLQLEKNDLEGNLVTFIIAGSETTSVSLSWCLYYLSLYPEAQARARAEVDSLGRDPETNDDLEELPFVESCFLEALRIQPPVTLLAHITTVEVSVHGYKLPAGTPILASTRKHMRSNAEGGTFFK
ncbi:hypothetical protein FOZ62_012098 [Perkinsus olseni]|uniref:Cytochrome P450 n=1 Tax=Perkinsus olseni TaxID=32597 RepID=A0A7J6TR80_PEROL|nr:hypothetical protein FOZ62_012098 [Perkinsus olseni]